MRRLLQVCGLLSVGLGSMAARAQLPTEADGDTPAEAPPPDDAPDTPYTRHMKNGVKLFREQNWDGAIAEFEAAYRAEPKASPLINLALTHKRLNNPAKAIEVLEQALAKHRDTMPPDQLAAAEKEIAEMRALLAFVTVTVTPPDAKLFVDDRAVAPGELALSPGTRIIRAEADGYEPQQTRVRIASGRENAPVSLALEPTVGELAVQAEDPAAIIEVDGREVGAGSWEGRLRPGMHVVRVIVDEEAQRLDVMVQPGEVHRVEQVDGELTSEAAMPREDDDDEDDGLFGPPKLKLLQGFYFVGSGSILTAGVISTEERPNYQVTGSDRFGGAGSLAVGYRVANWAGFEAFAQYSDIRTDGTISGDTVDPTPGPKDIPARMVLSSVRFGGLMRILLPGRNAVRFVGRVGGGAVYDRLRFNIEQSTDSPTTLFNPTTDVINQGFLLDGGKTDGFGFFAKVDFGVELEYENVLFDILIENAFQTSKHFDTDAGDNAFDTDPLIVVGLGLGVGYGIW